MDTRKIFSRAEEWKQKTHRLSLTLRLKTISEVKKFLREHGSVLWNAKAELPNLLDAMIGRVANGKERVYGKPAASCYLWRAQVLKDPEFLECRYFRRMSTAVHVDLWPYLVFFSRRNRAEWPMSRESKKIMTFLAKEGPTRTDLLRKALRYDTVAEGRSFQRAKRELQNLLILHGVDDEQAEKHTHAELLDFLENRVPKQIRHRADQTCEKEAKRKLLATTLNSVIICPEKSIPSWLPWLNGDTVETVESLVESKDFVRLENKKQRFIIPRKLLSLKTIR